MTRLVLLCLGLGAAPVASAQPFWERPPRLGLGLGLDLVVHLGPLDDKKRFGVAADGWAERTWLDRPYWRDTSGPQPTPAIRAEAQMGWSPPHGFSNLSLQVGGQLASGADGGYLTLGGFYGGAGLGMSTDGVAGPMLLTMAAAPLVAARLDTTRWQGAWGAPRLSVGPNVPMNCCGTYY